MKEDFIIPVLILLIGAGMGLGLYLLPKNPAKEDYRVVVEPAKIENSEPEAEDMAQIYTAPPQEEEIQPLTSSAGLPPDFRAVEVVSNDLPASAEFWTQAYCPGTGSAFEYTVPDGYRIESCQSGPVGSHNGCSYCGMAKIKLVEGQSNEPYEAGKCGAAVDYSYGLRPADELCAQGSAEGINCYYDDADSCKWCWSCGVGNGEVSCCESKTQAPAPQNNSKI